MLLLCFVETLLVIVWCGNGKSIIIDNRVWIYIVYMILSAFWGIIHSEQNSAYTIFIKLSLYLMVFFVFYVCGWQVIDFNYIIKLYINISIILSVLIIIQFIFSVAGKGFALVPPGIPLAGDDNGTSDAIRSLQLANNRFSTVFLEPSHQCQYVLPCLAVLIFRDGAEKKNRDFLWALLLTVGMFCTTSSVGIFSAVILWGAYIFLQLRKGNSKILLMIPVLIVVFLYFLSIDYVRDNVVTRLAVLDIRNTTRTEGFRRIRYGWFCYADLGIIEKIFGTGYKNFGYYLAEHDIGLKLIGTNELKMITYTNGITGMLIGIGIVGTVLNLRLFLVDVLKNRTSLTCGLLLAWAIIMFTSNSFDEITALIPMVLMMNISLVPESFTKKIKLALVR